MARKQKLKVFRTPIGFHDAYVAAPSQKAALEAWGSDKNLFAAGAAEQVDDPGLMAGPLANPGKVIRCVRGTAAEHMAALPKDAPRSKPKRKAEDQPEQRPSSHARIATRAKPKAKPKPRPSRTALDRAEAALATIEARHREASDAFACKQADLDRERRELEERQARERDAIERRIDAARGKYEKAMRAWRAD
ncbi:MULTISPECIES: hypothetical protein [unclassified Sphingomonas]|uniref:hypothetical protein n=1 Tax=unclassified Sphingomonas TaxID=196159 RepID=UPI000926C895|nr:MULTISPECIES: hypothetical protein [unclassified Sphingomonas]MBN8849996.1 hypothetical protein [Sphingomonas sp.]OJV32270.1 MAG: hypothetical protein BGO24_15950 [Sphingomonas sp. 67-36]